MKINLFLLPMIIITLMLVGCSATEPYPEDDGERPYLGYQPKIQRGLYVKYPVKLGVLYVRDQRKLLFYDEEDDYFDKRIDRSVSNMIFSEMKGSGLFKKVILIKETPPNILSKKFLSDIRNNYKVDMILVTDLTKFNMLREKSGDNVIDTFKISVDVAFVSQLIYLRNGLIIWANSVERTRKDLAKDGALEAQPLGELSCSVMRAAVADIKVLIQKTGLVIKKKRSKR